MDRIGGKCEKKMNNTLRKALDKSFTVVSYASLAGISLAVALFLIPIIYNGIGAFIFSATVEHDKFLVENLNRSPTPAEENYIKLSNAARKPLYKMMSEYECPTDMGFAKRINLAFDSAFKEMNKHSDLLLSFLDLKGNERVEKIRELSEKLWSPYVETLKGIVSNAQEDGTSFALINILQSQRDRLSEASRDEIKTLNQIKKLTFTQRSIIRRNITLVPNTYIGEAISILEERNAAYETLKSGIRELLGPPDIKSKEASKLMRQRYGQTRTDMAKRVLRENVLEITIKTTNPDAHETVKRVKSAEYFKDPKIKAILAYIEDNFDSMLQPHATLYWGFFFDDPYDSNIFGGIWPMILGTFYLTLGSMLIAAPLGIVASIYFSEYSKGGKIIGFLRICVGTLAGVPSIVFGLFGLAFLINTVKISDGKSAFAGSVTLSILILPTIIKSCEEALKAVPNSYREAALSLGAGKWKSICTVILPAALPAMLTGIIISMGRAAGETAPIIFTAATSTGAALAISEIFTQPTPALPWNIYNICSEHEMAERVSHVQYGMVLTLIAIVLALNAIAIVIRAKLQKKIGN